MEVEHLVLDGVLLLKPNVFTDKRGWFLQSFQQQQYQTIGINDTFVQDNLSHSIYATLRGMHYQYPHSQAKLVTVIHGSVFDVVVDIRVGSPSFGQWLGVELSDKNHRQLFVPAGFAHGFVVLSQTADFHYKCSDYYNPSTQASILWNDPDIGINWPLDQPILSDKDQNAKPLREIPEQDLPRY